MITKNFLNQLAIKNQTTLVNTYREYCQNVFLSFLFQGKAKGNFLFKGGTALRLVYGSPRYSEDLDFSLFQIKSKEIEEILLTVAGNLEKNNLSPKIIEAKQTTGGYLADLELILHDQKIKISLQGSLRKKNGTEPNVQLILNDFIPPYTVSLLPEEILIGEKISAALTRGKPRDFFDIYFLIKKGLIPIKLRSSLKPISELLKKKKIPFKKELAEFLPRSLHGLTNNFEKILTNEINKV